MFEKSSRVILATSGLICHGIGQASHAQSDVRITGTYTNMYYNKEGGDVLGEELKIVDTPGGHYQGALQFAKGEPGPLIVVDINLSGNRISFAVPDVDSNGGSFSGTLAKDSISGDFHFKQGGIENVVLKKGRSYWE